MAGIETYRRELRQLEAWDTYLLENSGLPGPRGNLELAQAVAELGTPQDFERYRAYDAATAPVNSPYEFLAFCGVLGLGRLLAEGQAEHLETLRIFASDPRWRVREAVAMALQRLGVADMPRLLEAMSVWSRGNLLERRAAVAALCEPGLLGQPDHARAVLGVLERITASVSEVDDRKSEDFRVLRKGLAYCWSVAAAALPEEGKQRMEVWFSRPDPDVRWLMRENLKKRRLVRLDPEWTENWLARL